MTIHNMQPVVSLEPFHWRPCEDGKHQAQLVEFTDAAGRTHLDGYIRKVVSDPKAQRDVKPSPAALKIDIPHLQEEALFRHRHNPCLKLTPSPSMKHLQVGLWLNEDYSNNPEKAGALYSGTLGADGRPSGSGWVCLLEEKTQLIGNFREGYLHGNHCVMEYLREDSSGRRSAWIEGRFEDGGAEGFSIYYSGHKDPNGAPTLKVRHDGERGSIYETEADGSWYRGTMQSGEPRGRGVASSLWGSGRDELESVKVGEFDFTLVPPKKHPTTVPALEKQPRQVIRTFAGAVDTQSTKAATESLLEVGQRPAHMLRYLHPRTAAGNQTRPDLRVTGLTRSEAMVVQQIVD